MLVVVEGADGCGKTSVAEAVARHLEAELIHFPNDETVTGPLIRSYLRKEWRISPVQKEGSVTALVTTVDPSALAFQALNIANRMELMPDILQALRGGQNIVLARYWQSAFVYGQLDGLSPEWIIQVHAAMPRGDLNILLDAPAEICMQRRAARDGALPPERYEGKLDFTRKVVDLYRGLWETNSANPKWVRIDATKPFIGVANDAIAAVGKHIGV